MKRSFLLLLTIVAFAWQGHAQQISKHAIGLRLGDSDGFGPEINYQHGLTENQRLEFGFSWHGRRHHDAVKLVGLYEWVWNIEGGFNWYVGPGAGFGNIKYDYSDYWGRHRKSDFYAFVTGTIGVEYGFDFPLLLSLDLRPQINFGYPDDVLVDVGISARYKF